MEWRCPDKLSFEQTLTKRECREQTFSESLVSTMLATGFMWNLVYREGHPGRVTSAKFSPSASNDGTVTLWNLDLDALLSQSCSWLRDYLQTNPKGKQGDRHLCDVNQTLLPIAIDGVQSSFPSSGNWYSLSEYFWLHI